MFEEEGLISCKWSYEDCKFDGQSKCDICFTEGMHYKPVVIKKKSVLRKHANKADGRAGSSFELRNQKINQKVLDSTCDMTLNSGATVREKGDAQIKGLLSIMEEYKTRTKVQAPGKKTFTIQKEWLEKLEREARAENKEFFDLRFSFHEDDKQAYVILPEEEFISWIKTLNEDRKKTLSAQAKIDLVERQKDVVIAENKLLQAKLDEMEAQIKCLKMS